MAKPKKSKKATNELSAVGSVHAALVNLSPDERQRVLASVQALLDIPGVPPLISEDSTSGGNASSGTRPGRRSGRAKSTGRKSSGRKKSTGRKSSGRKASGRKASGRKASGRKATKATRRGSSAGSSSA
jgi:hypothetical protein